MSFYRTILAAVAAVAIATPVFADDTTSAAPASADAQPAATQTTDASAQAATTASAEQTKININKASTKDLMKIKGLNASKARAIVAYRKKHGEFKTTDDLSNVKGFTKMNPEALKDISSQLSVE